MIGEPDLGEQALSKVAEMGIASQLDEVENLDVEIRTNPFQLMQGKVDSVTIAGEGAVMNQDLRMESFEVRTGTIAINAGSALFGKIELTQPADANARFVLHENDLNRAFSSDFLREKLQNVTVQVNGQPVLVDIMNAKIDLLDAQKLELEADVLLKETNETHHFKANATPKVQEQGQRIGLDILSTEAEGLSPEITDALCNTMMEFLDLRNFNLQGMSLTLQRLDMDSDRLTLNTTTTIEEFPSA
jgi:hypothetical protein